MALALIVAAVLDIVSTYMGTPGLSGEANRVLIMFGRKWTYVVAFKVVVSIFAVVAFAGGLRILQNRVERLTGTTGFVNVLSLLIFKRRVSFVQFLLYGWPKDWVSVFAVGGITIGITPVIGGLTAAILNTFKAVRSQTQLMVYLFGTAALGVSIALWITYQFFVKQRKVG